MRITTPKVKLPCALREERGITVVIVLAFTLLAGLVVAAAYAATRSEVHLSAAATSQKKAYYAAQYGVSSYLEHLLRNGSYLTYCTAPPEYNEHPSENPLNNYYQTASGTTLLRASELHRVPVPGTQPGEEEYAIQLVPQTYAPAGEKECKPGNIANTMIETKGQVKGSFRIKVTGFSRVSGSHYETRSIVATLHNEGFVSFVYYTQFETMDPAAYPTFNEYVSGSRLHTRTEAEEQCEKVYYSAGGSRPSWCEPIYFTSGDEVRGPLHTEDHVGIIGSPIFGREPSDPIEFRDAAVDSCGRGGPDEGYSEEAYGLGCGSPVFKGQHIPPAAVHELKPPPSDQELRRIAEHGGYLLAGAKEIVLEGTTLRIKQPGTTEAGESKPFPENGVIYVANSGSCSGYPYYNPAYPGQLTCGNAYVRGSYTKSLTIASENDIVIDGSVTTTAAEGKPIGSAVLGLIAEDFVRVYHPVLRFAGSPSCSRRGCYCNTSPESTYNSANGKCEYINDNFACDAPSLTGSGTAENPNPLPGTEGSMAEPDIDAAILALNHSFTVDNYQCPAGGPSLGTLVIRGGIAQRFRGVVGESWGNGGHSGYFKNYEYDNRLLAEEPPYFLNPVQAAWKIERETLAPSPPK